MNAPQPPPGADSVFGDRLPSAVQYVAWLAGAGIERGLIGPRERDRLWDRHVLNCVGVAGLLPDGVAVVDVGSGAGLPGLVVAIARPDLRVTLLEPLLRRTAFLSEVVADLRLTDRVEVLRSRAEDVHDRRWDAVLSRAVAPLDRLLGWCLPIMAPAGEVLALKGDRAQSELDECAGLLARRRLAGDIAVVRAHDGADPTSVVRIRRVDAAVER